MNEKLLNERNKVIDALNLVKESRAVIETLPLSIQPWALICEAMTGLLQAQEKLGESLFAINALIISELRGETK